MTAPFNLIHDRVLGGFRNNRIAIKFRKFHETYRTYRSNPRSLVSFSALTLAEQLLVIVQSWLVAWALGVHVGIVCFAVAVPLSILVARIPIGIGGIRNLRGGVRLSAIAGQASPRPKPWRSRSRAAS